MIALVKFLVLCPSDEWLKRSTGAKNKPKNKQNKPQQHKVRKKQAKGGHGVGRRRVGGGGGGEKREFCH